MERWRCSSVWRLRWAPGSHRPSAETKSLLISRPPAPAAGWPSGSARAPCPSIPPPAPPIPNRQRPRPRFASAFCRRAQAPGSFGRDRRPIRPDLACRTAPWSVPRFRCAATTMSRSSLSMPAWRQTLRHRERHLCRTQTVHAVFLAPIRRAGRHPDRHGPSRNFAMPSDQSPRQSGRFRI